MTVGVLIPTLNGAASLDACLRAVLAAAPDDVLIVDSESDDGTRAIAASHGVAVLGIPRRSFNHGLTREMGRKELGTDVVVMLSQDVVLASPGAIASVVAPIAEGRAAAAYGRQLVEYGDRTFEGLTRAFSYPAHDQIRTRDDLVRLGARACRFSNAFGAWSNRALDAVGGFERVLSNEDVLAAARLLNDGYPVQYVSDACCHHAHELSLADDFRRFFHAGYIRWEHRALFGGSDTGGGAGSAYARAILSQTPPRERPRALARLAARAAGYKAGRMGDVLPLRGRAWLSGTSGYWRHAGGSHA